MAESGNEPQAPSNHAILLDDFLAQKIVQPPSIIGRGILPVESKLFIGGRPKQGKSFLATNIGLDIAQGRPLFGAKFPDGTPIFPVHESSPVLYIEKEIGLYSLKERMIEMKAKLERPPGIPFYIVPKAYGMRLDKKDGRDMIEAEIARTRPKVVILDPLAKFHGVDENSNQDMSAVLRRLDDLIEKYHCAFIIIHHIGHENPEFERKGGDALRGATALYGDIDSVILHKRLSAEYVKEPKVKLEFDLRHGAPIMPMTFQRKDGGIYEYLGSDEEETEKTARKKQAKTDEDLLESRALD